MSPTSRRPAIKTAKEYVESGHHLPAPLRDFHDAKDLFKLMHRRYGSRSEGLFKYYEQSVNWVLGQCYVIDWFLWFMAQHGWTLQRSRSKVDFRNLDAALAEMKAEMREEFRAALQSRGGVVESASEGDKS